MATYIVSVKHTDSYELEADTSDEALRVAEDCVTDNYGRLYFDNAVFNVSRIDIPQPGDLSDAGMDGA